MEKKENKGFTLAELLVVVAIITVIVAISIPIFSSQLEKARQATDLANIRAAYAEIMTAVVSDDTTFSNVEYTNYYKNGHLDSNPNVLVKTGKNIVLYAVNINLTSNSNTWSDAEENIKDLFDTVDTRSNGYNYAVIVYFHNSNTADRDNGLYLLYTPIPVTPEITDGMLT